MEYWLEQAKAVPCGSTRRIQCCSKDNSMIVSHTMQGYSCHCFRCGEHKYHTLGSRSLGLLASQRADLSFREEIALDYPKDYTLEIPTAYLPWLLKASVGSYLRTVYGIGWSPAMQRIILPTRAMNGELIYIQSRAVLPQQKPKYLNKSGTDVRSIMTWSIPSTLLSTTILGPEVLVICEDFLSAIRIGRVQSSCSILGTTLTDARLSQIAARYRKCILWLDPDKAGRDGSNVAAKKLRLQGITTSSICTNKDPKFYNNDEIKEILLR